MFAGSQRIADLLLKGYIRQDQIDNRIDHLNNADVGRKRPIASVDYCGEADHRAKHHKSKPFRDAQGTQPSSSWEPPNRKRKREEDDIFYTQDVT